MGSTKVQANPGNLERLCLKKSKNDIPLYPSTRGRAGESAQIWDFILHSEFQTSQDYIGKSYLKMGGGGGGWGYSLVVGCLPGMWVAKSQHYKKQLIKQYRITVSTLEDCGKWVNVKVFYSTEICPSLFGMVCWAENFRSSRELPQSYYLLKRAPCSNRSTTVARI